MGGLPADTCMNLGFDGVGTKMELAERIAKHDTIAYDLFAMVCDDAVVRGGEPVLVGSILDVRSLGTPDEPYIDFVKQLAVGYINAAKEANVAVVNGEVAELGVRVSGYGPFNYNWGAGIAWFSRESRMFKGNEVRPGDKLVGLREKGFRSNGLSLVRKILRKEHGEHWHDYEYHGKNLAALALLPSRIYASAVVTMIGAIDQEPMVELHGVAHITGGGIPGKLGRVLEPSGLGAYIEDPFDPCTLMHYCQEKGGVTDQEAYQIWNMGQGMILITPSPDETMRVASMYGIESKIIGEVCSKPSIIIKNKGLHSASHPLLIF